MKKIFAASAITLACLAPIAQNAHAADPAGYTKTKYPIVLVHGIFGFDTFQGAPYFYGIEDALKKDAGGATTYIATVSAAGSNEARGLQLYNYLKSLRAQGKGTKFNLVGHSQGSPTARWVATQDPGIVASVTSVDGVNKGSRVADIVRKVAPAGTVTEAIAKSVADGFTWFLVKISGNPTMQQSTIDALNSLTTPGLTAFNSRNPAGVPSGCGDGAWTVNITGKTTNATSAVNFYSWGGKGNLTNPLDLLDPGIGFLSLAFTGSGLANDGLVSTCSQRLGRVIRADYLMNHLDAVNGWFGWVSPFETNPKTVYRQHANRLKNAGL